MAAPLPRTRDEIAALLQACEVPEALATQIVDQARPALVLTTVPADDGTIPIGTSKFGGLPDLPAGQGWPERPPYGNAEALAARYRSKATRTLRMAAEPGYWATETPARMFADEDLARADAADRAFPLAFMVQLDLAALAGEPGFDRGLPDHGRLLVFYDWWLNPAPFEPQSRPGWRVLWDTTPLAELVRHSAPDTLAALCTEKWTTIFSPARAMAETVFCWIPPSGWVVDEIDAEPGALSMVLEALDDGDWDGGTRHQLAGWPQLLQHGLQRQCQLADNGLYCGTPGDFRTPEAEALLLEAGEWQLVLQIGSGFIGNGALYVMMRQADIASRAFDRAWVAYQSG